MLEVRDDTIVISKSDQPRNGWEEALNASTSFEDELLIDDSVVNDFGGGEWTW